MAFPYQSFKARYYKNYINISRAIQLVYNIKYSCIGISNYFSRANNFLVKTVKDLGKIRKGRMRWSVYRNKINKVVSNHKGAQHYTADLIKYSWKMVETRLLATEMTLQVIV